MDRAALAAAYARRTSAVLWGGGGRYHSYAKSNPGEAGRLDAYVAALVAGEHVEPPQLATEFGRMIVGLIAAGAAPQPQVAVSVGPAAAGYSGPLVVEPLELGGAASMDVYVDGVRAATVKPGGSWTWDTSKVEDGPHTLAYVFVDQSGHEVGRAEPVALRVANG